VNSNTALRRTRPVAEDPYSKIRQVSGFLGGSAWAMAKDIAEGHILTTERMMRRLNRAELDKLAHEVDRKLRELRGETPEADDTAAVQARHRRIQRLRGALTVVQGVRSRPSP
jgi:hypothetical protein